MRQHELQNRMEQDKMKLVIYAFILSHFNYYLLNWMFHDKRMNCNLSKFNQRGLTPLRPCGSPVTRILKPQ